MSHFQKQNFLSLQVSDEEVAPDRKPIILEWLRRNAIFSHREENEFFLYLPGTNDELNERWYGETQGTPVEIMDIMNQAFDFAQEAGVETAWVQIWWPTIE